MYAQYRIVLCQGMSLLVPQPAPKKAGFSPCSMSKPDRNASPIEILRARTFFVTTKTSMGRALLQSERNATLLIDVLRSYVAARKFRVHDFVVMPDHVHLLITVDADYVDRKGCAAHQGGLFVSVEEGVWVHRRGVATRIFACSNRGS
jgi:hypothetical protein